MEQESSDREAGRVPFPAVNADGNMTGGRACAFEAAGKPSRSFFLARVWRFYVEGFRSMTWGRTLWVIILVKLFVMFAILKVFFFPDFLRGKTEEEKQAFVGNALIERVSTP